ncbi:MAG: cation transporter, partial [Sarcina sp.]
MSEVKLYLEGLDCAGCAGKIEDKTAHLEKVKEASLNFTTKALLIELHDKKDQDEVVLEVKGIVNKLEPDVVVKEINKKESVKLKNMKITLENLDCAGCAGKIEEKTNGLSGVKEASLNFSTKALFIDLNEGTDDESIYEEVKKIVFKLEPDVIVNYNKEEIKDSFKLTFKDLNCAGCAGKIEEKSNALAQVKEATLNFAAKKMVVTLNDANDIDKVKKAIRDITFKLEPDVEVIDEEEVNYEEEIIVSDEPKKIKTESNLTVFNIGRFIIGVILFIVA